MPSARLNDRVTSLLDPSRLAAPSWQPHPDRYDLAEIVQVAFHRLPRQSGTGSAPRAPRPGHSGTRWARDGGAHVAQ